MSELSKEELIKAIEVMRDDFEYNAKMVNVFARIVNLAKQLSDTPKKVVVPKRFEDWVQRVTSSVISDENKKTKAIALISRVGWGYGLTTNIANESESGYEDVQDWIQKDNNQILAIEAILYGYEVEQPKQYRVKRKNWWFEKWFSPETAILSAHICNAYDFTDKRKAELVAELISGTVEEV